MKNINQLTILGHLGKDILVAFTSSGQPYARFSVCVREEWQSKKDGKKQESTQWFNCVVWGENAKLWAETYKKGDEVRIEGKINSSQYEKDGIKKESWQVTCFKMQLAEEKGTHKKMQESLPWANEIEGDDVPF